VLACSVGLDSYPRGTAMAAGVRWARKESSKGSREESNGVHQRGEIDAAAGRRRRGSRRHSSELSALPRPLCFVRRSFDRARATTTSLMRPRRGGESKQRADGARRGARNDGSGGDDARSRAKSRDEGNQLPLFPLSSQRLRLCSSSARRGREFYESFTHAGHTILESLPLDRCASKSGVRQKKRGKRK